jgi:excisionase family DNA binding protein
MAAFHLIIYGRFSVITEECTHHRNSSSGDSPKAKRRRGTRLYDPTSPFPQMCDAEVVAAAMGCTTKHIYSLVATNAIPHSRFGNRVQFPVAGVAAYLAEHVVVAA